MAEDAGASDKEAQATGAGMVSVAEEAAPVWEAEEEEEAGAAREGQQLRGCSPGWQGCSEASLPLATSSHWPASPPGRSTDGRELRKMTMRSSLWSRCSSPRHS